MNDREKRRAARAGWAVRKYALGEEPDHDLSLLSVAERVALVWRLTQDAWSTGKLPYPDYTRAETPARLVRRHELQA